MATALTGSRVKDTYSQLLHVDGGVGSAEKIVRTGTGAATALSVGTNSVAVENIRLDGNTISTINADGDLNLTPNGTGKVVIGAAQVTGGTVSGITDLAIADGGTGASTAADARTNLGLGSMATQNASTVAITGGSVLASTATGYGTTGGIGGGVTQDTSKSTTVVLNKPCGQITMHNASLAAGARVSFTLTNSSIAATDVVVVNISSAATADAYALTVTAVAAGSCRIQLANLSASPLGEALVLNFAVIKATNA
ncbi:MAG: hypothetical protein ABFE08_17845 [Armatimonadia bacterium]